MDDADMDRITTDALEHVYEQAREAGRMPIMGAVVFLTAPAEPPGERLTVSVQTMTYIDGMGPDDVADLLARAAGKISQEAGSGDVTVMQAPPGFGGQG